MPRARAMSIKRWGVSFVVPATLYLYLRNSWWLSKVTYTLCTESATGHPRETAAGRQVKTALMQMRNTGFVKACTGCLIELTLWVFCFVAMLKAGFRLLPQVS